jgi:hypothetical protein
MDIFNQDLFENLVEQAAVSPLVKSFDPIADIMTKPTIAIRYTRKVKNNAVSAFMNISVSNRNWIKQLLEDLLDTMYTFSADNTIMISPSTAKPRNGKTQMWETFITELYTDKCMGKADFSEGQIRHLPKFLNEISTKGQRFKGCGAIEFIDADTGVVLS